MREMSVLDILNLLLKRWWIILGLAAIFGSGMFIFTSLTYVQEYSATGTIFASNGAYTYQQFQGSATADKIQSSDLAASVSLIPSYLELLRSDKLADEVATKVKWDNPSYNNLTTNQVTYMTSFSSREETTIIDVWVRSTDPELAEAVSSAYLELAPDFLSRYIGTDNVASELDSTTIRKLGNGATSDGIKVAIIVAVIVSAIIILFGVLDNRVRGEEDFVANYDVPVLGTIPVFEIALKKGATGYESKK